MKALVRYSHEPRSVRVQELPEPELNPGQILVKVAACGICGSDVHFRHESDRPEKRYPYIIGHEFAGTVVALGEGVEGFSAGEGVACRPLAGRCGVCRMCRQGRFNNCRMYGDIGFGNDGGCAQLVAYDAEGCHRLPDTVSSEDAAIVEPLALAHTSVFDRARVCSGEFVVVMGCGPMGLLCAALAVGAGAEVLVSGWTGDDTRLAAARALGVHHVVSSAETDLPALAESLTGVDGPDAIIDAVGSSDTFAQALDMAPPLGRITKVGWFGETRDMNWNAMVRKNLEVRGAYGNTFDTWEKCIRLLAMGSFPIEHIFTHRLPLDDFEEGYRLMDERDAVKVLLLLGK